jgi:hypothetical protein
MKSKNKLTKRKISFLIVVIILVISIILYVFTKLTYSCDSELYEKPRFQFDEISNSNNLQITYSFSNKGDAYSIKLYRNNNTLHYSRVSPISEEFIGAVEEETLINLTEEFVLNKFGYMKELYFCSQIADQGISRITVISDNQSLSVAVYSWDGPSGFYVIKNSILDILKNLKKNE